MTSFKDKILNHNSEYDPLSWKKFKELSASNTTKRELGVIETIIGNIANSTFIYFSLFLVIISAIVLFFFFTNKSNNDVRKNNLNYTEKHSVSSKKIEYKGNSTYKKMEIERVNIGEETISSSSILEENQKNAMSTNQTGIDKLMNMKIPVKIIDEQQANKKLSMNIQNDMQNNEKNSSILDNTFDKNDIALSSSTKSDDKIFDEDIQNNRESTFFYNSVLGKLNVGAIYIKANRESILQSPSIKMFKNTRYISFLFGAGFGIIQNREYDVFPNYTYSIYGRRDINQKFYLAASIKYNELYLGKFSETIKEDNSIVSTLQFAEIRRKQLSNSLSLGYNIISTGVFIEGGILFHLNLSHSMTGTKIDRLNEIVISKVDLSKIKFGSSFSLGFTLGLGYINYWDRYHIKTELKYNSEFPSTPGIKTNFKVSKDNISLTFGFGYLLKI